MSKLFSMTGFARRAGKVGGRQVSVEIKSVNHRYLDLKIKLPRELSAFEGKVQEVCRKELHRGHLDIWVNIGPGEASAKVSVNESLARGIALALGRMKDELGLQGEPDISLLAAQEGVILVESGEGPGDESWPEFESLISGALASLKEMRAREAESLAADLFERLGSLDNTIGLIEAKVAGVPALYKEKLEKRIAELMGPESAPDPERLAQEVAIFADKADVTEEIVRARSHLGQFRSLVEQGGAVGRKLDFLLQELFREINTASNKSQSAEVSAVAVDFKAELEKMREQVQNLE